MLTVKYALLFDELLTEKKSSKEFFQPYLETLKTTVSSLEKDIKCWFMFT